jgi:hypothetical protein
LKTTWLKFNSEHKSEKKNRFKIWILKFDQISQLFSIWILVYKYFELSDINSLTKSCYLFKGECIMCQSTNIPFVYHFGHTSPNTPEL